MLLVRFKWCILGSGGSPRASGGTCSCVVDICFTRGGLRGFLGLDGFDSVLVSSDDSRFGGGDGETPVNGGFGRCLKLSGKAVGKLPLRDSAGFARLVLM